MIPSTRPFRPLAPRALAASLVLALAAPVPLRSQTPPSSPEPPVFGVSAATVLLDIVVRDGKGRLVRDLKAEDFEVYEDNVRQTVDSFRVVDTRPAEAPEAAATQATPAPASGAVPAPASPAPDDGPEPPAAPAVVAFVFDRLSPNARDMAGKAARIYTDRGHTDGDLAGVFSIDLALRTLQPFTSDVESIRTGLKLASTQANTEFASDREDARRRAETIARSETALDNMAAGGEGGSTAAAMLASQVAFDQVELEMSRAFDALERDQQGFASTHGLLAVVNGLKALPGRKTIVFFSEGIAIPANVQEQFHSVITSANRANVAIYAVDAGGLRAESGTREAREELVQSSARRLRQEEQGGRGLPMRESLNRGMERNEDMLRLNPESGLGQLAAETGGFLVRDTNDAREGFGRITEEMRFHYVVSYAPTNDKLDGSYRTIAVKVHRPGLRVQTRKGYLALKPAEYILPVREYEAPALAQLDRQPRPDAFPLHAGAYSFPEGERPGLAPVLVRIPGGTMTWSTDGKGGVRADFAVLVKIRDERGREVDRMSQDYRLTAPAAKLETARRGDVLFYREADLPAGRYTAEAVGYDALAKSASVRSFALEIPPADPERLRLSSLLLVDRAEQLRPDEQKDTRNPLHFGEAILYPNLGTPLRKSQLAAVGFFFSVYGKDLAAAKSATIEVARGGQVVARTDSELPAPDARGRIQHAGALPLKGFAPGEYRLRVSVSDGRSVLSRDAPFTVAE
jgi:VWFA-related protein